MTRLIDADALMASMYDEAFEKDTDMQRWDSGCWIRYKLFENVLDEQPAIDAVPAEFVMENCNLEFVCDALTDDGEWCSEHCQYSEPQPECIHRYIDRIWRKEHDTAD